MTFKEKAIRRYRIIGEGKPSRQLDSMLTRLSNAEMGPDYGDEEWGHTKRSSIEHRHNAHTENLRKAAIKQAAKEELWDLVDELSGEGGEE